MRTQKILVAAATLAVSLASSMAQVYSQNIVGYINLTLQPGFNLVANQLNNGAGSNSLSAVFPNGALPDGSLLYKFNAGTFSVDYFNGNSSLAPVGWYDNTSGNPSTTTVNPGEGFYVNLAGVSPVTVTLVGSVQTGTNTVVLTPGFKLVSSVTPESYSLNQPDFPATDGMLYYQYNSGTFTTLYYNGNSSLAPIGWYDNTSGNPANAQPAVGQGFYINTPGVTSINWTRAFNPN